MLFFDWQLLHAELHNGGHEFEVVEKPLEIQASRMSKDFSFGMFWQMSFLLMKF